MQSTHQQIDQLPHPLNRILQVAHSLLEKGAGDESNRERIAAAFVLERMEYIPRGRGVIEAWESLDIEWQLYVRHLWEECGHLIKALKVDVAGREQ
ncbi:hypothetical protein [Microbulbifer litoralis]|uniref:hypothetical protein n=1 Tax=Microbulbifer litoralis TaxID=2933965 RepID=UPI0020288844|nr:hypothetical protein [Microbulbifer sp. GX H0434]